MARGLLRTRRASRRVAQRLALGAVLAAALAAPSGASATPSKVKGQLKAAAAPVSELTPTDKVPLPGGATLYRFEQRVSGISVLGSGAVVSNPPGAPPDLIVDHTKPSVQAPPAPRVSEARALETASSAVGVKRLRGRRSASLAIEPGKGGTLVWRVLVPSARPLGSFEVLVDARSGDVVRKRNMIRDYRTGHAKLFNPNPVVERAHSGSLKGLMGDHRDRDTALLTRLRRAVKLPRIRGGQHCLRGQWAHAKVGPSGGREVCKLDLRWGRVTRSDDRFEALMTYFHVTRAQKYIHQLGFSNGHHNGIDDKSQVVVADAFKIDNSFFDPVPDRIEYGSGGVDDAEDADVILHEYGHAMQFSQSPQFLESSGGDAGPLQEGSADYWAAVMSSLSPDTHNEDDVCIFDWDGITYGFPFAAKPPYTVGRFCGRRADFMKTVSQAQSSSSDPHYVGQVWSTALWDIRNAIGGFTADQIYLTAQFTYQANEHFNGSNGAGQALLNADQALTGGLNQATICGEMAARGISVPGC